MSHSFKCFLGFICIAFCSSWLAASDGLLPIDAIIEKQAKYARFAPPADDAQFLRRVYLDLAGRIPSIHELKSFIEDNREGKRAIVIDSLLSGPDYPRRMHDQFHAMLMERRGDNVEWSKFLQTAFQANQPWDQIARDILDPDPEHPEKRGAAFFSTVRLDKVGTQEVDYAGLTRDVGRLFLGMDLQCAQCHNHLTIDDYKQQDFQGLFVVFQNTSIRRDVDFPAIAEKPVSEKLAFSSVFDNVSLATGPKIPGLPEVLIPKFEKGEEFLVPPDKKTKFDGVPRFSPLEAIAHEMPTAKNEAFARNMANRLWFVMFGRGLVNPLDQQHKENPASHPELLELLTREFVAHQYDMKWLLRELALSETYQRSSILPSSIEAAPELYVVANEKRLSGEQLCASMLQATGPWPPADDSTNKTEESSDSKSPLEVKDGSSSLLVRLPELALREAFVKAFSNPAKEPESEFAPSLKSALFLMNDPAVLGLLVPHSGNLMERTFALPTEEVADELYRSVLTRKPTDDERTATLEYLNNNSKRRASALSDLAWSLLTSTEFVVNH